MAKDIEPVGRQVKVDADTGNHPYTDLGISIAHQGNLLSDMGASVAQAAANARAIEAGTAAGENPKGEALPTFSEAQKNYAAAYEAQSQNVMSIRLNKLSAEANSHIAKANKINPNMISTYTKELSEGATEILNQAPSTVRHALGAQFANQLISNTERLNQKLITQQKDEALNHADVAAAITNENIATLAMNGNPEAAYNSYVEARKLNENNFLGGTWDEKKRFLADQTTMKSYYFSRFNAQLVTERAKGGEALGKYLTSFTDIKNKPEEMPASTWAEIGQGVLNTSRQIDALQATEKDNLVSGLQEKMAEGVATPQDFENVMSNPVITQSDQNKIWTQFFNHKGSSSKSEQSVTAVMNDFGNPKIFAQATPETRDTAFKQNVDIVQQQNPGRPREGIELQVAIAAGGPIPTFIKGLEGRTTSSNLQVMSSAVTDYRRVQAEAPANLVGFDKTAADRINAYETFLRVNPSNPELALAKAHEVTTNLPPEEAKKIKESWQPVRQKRYGLEHQQVNFVNDILGTGGVFGENLQDPLSAKSFAMSVLDRNIELFRGDIEAATNATKQEVASAYSTTSVNGITEKGMGALEKVTKVGDGGTFFIQKNIANQVQAQFNQYKDAYDKGDSNYYYRIKDLDKWNSNSVDVELQKQNEQLAQGPIQPPRNETRVFEQTNVRNRLEPQVKPRQIEVEQVWRGTGKEPGRIEVMPMAVMLAPNAREGYGAQSLIGDYEVKLVTPNGYFADIPNINTYKATVIKYFPDSAKIQSDFINYNKVTHRSKATLEELLNDYLAKDNNTKHKAEHNALTQIIQS